MTLKTLIRDLADTMDGAGREFKRGFAGAFRKRGGKHRADAEAIRGWDRRHSSPEPRHRAQRRASPSHAKEYDILDEVSRGIDARGHTPRHRDPDYDPARDLGGAVGQAVRSIPGDVLSEVKGIPKKVPEQFAEEFYQDAIGQSGPDKYGPKSAGDERFLAPAAEAEALSGLSLAELETRFGLEPGSLDGATVVIKEIPGSRFVSVEVETPGR